MPKRAGDTVKVSISLHKDTVAALRKRAKRLYGGNLSAVVAELAEDARLLEGMDALIESLGGPSLTDEARARIDAEWAGRPAPVPEKSKKRKRKAA